MLFFIHMPTINAAIAESMAQTCDIFIYITIYPYSYTFTMAEGHDILSSSISNLELSSCQAELTVNGKYDKSIIEKNLKLA